MKGRRLPAWSKALVVIVLAVFAGTMTLFTKSVFELRTLSQLVRDPAYVRKCVDKIADLPNPLPEGYKAELGIDFELLRLSIVSIRHVPGEQQLVLFSVVTEQPANADSKVLLERFYDYGINTPSVSARFTDLKSKGEIQVAGETMPYMLGQLSDSRRKFEGMIACLYLKQKKKTFLAYALEPSGKPLDPEILTRLLKNIKKF